MAGCGWTLESIGVFVILGFYEWDLSFIIVYYLGFGYLCLVYSYNFLGYSYLLGVACYVSYLGM